LNTAVSATDQGTCSTSNTNSCFASGTEPIGGAAFYGSSINFALNFTGNNGGSSGGSYFLATGVGGGSTLITSNFLPQFKFESVPYYVGVWEAPNNPEVDLPTAVKTNYCVTALSEQIPCLTFYVLIPFQPTVVSVQPSIDTGGFFGPIIRALIAIGVFIVSNIISFFAYLYGLIVPILAGLASIIGAFLVAILNAFGGIFGASSLGTQLQTLFNSILGWFTQIFGSAMNLFTQFFTFMFKMVTTLTNFFAAGNPFIGFIVNFLDTLTFIPALLTTFWNDFMTYYASGVFTVQTVLVFYYIFGIYQVYVASLEGNGVKGFLEWLEFSETIFFTLFKAAFWFANESWEILLTLKQLIFGNQVSPVQVAGTG
jgi:hypothetical protein